MKCPKCGGDIPFYNLKPNCMHCGVNIMYFSQQEGLMRDAKRTELEGGAARMIIARVKAAFIGSKPAIFRMVLVVLAVGALVAPYGSARYTVPFFDGKFSVGIIGLIQGFQNGLLMKIPQLLQSAVLSKQTAAALVSAAVFVIVALIDVAIFCALLLGFLNLTKSTKFMMKASMAGMIVCVVGQIAAAVMKATTADTTAASVALGFGALASCAVFLALFLLNRSMLKKGVEPVYKENDIKRRDMLKKVRAGEVDLDDLPLPVFESEEEHAERLKALEEALKAEEEGKEL